MESLENVRRTVKSMSALQSFSRFGNVLNSFETGLIDFVVDKISNLFGMANGRVLQPFLLCNMKTFIGILLRLYMVIIVQ